MTATQLKNTINKKVSKINDEKFLNALKLIIETKENSDVYKVSDMQRRMLMQSRRDVEKGKVFSNAQVFKEAKKWLKEK